MQIQNDNKLKQRAKKYLFEALKMILILFVVANIVSYFRAPKLNDEKLPVLNLVTIDGQTIDTSTFSGKPVLLHFWATWCPTCKAELSNIEWISQHFPVIGVAVKSGSDDALREFMQNRNLAFRVVNDQTGLAEQFAVTAYPTTFIFDSEGKHAFTEVGYTSTIGLYLRMWWAK